MIQDECWPTAHDRREVLLFEDNQGDARLLSAELAGQSLIDIHLAVASRLSEGLQLLADREFDAVLLDLNLPDSHGMETFERVRSAVPELPLIVYTGIQDGKTARQVLRGGAQDYILKSPGVGPLLVRAVYFAIERQQAGVELCRRAARLAENQATLRRVIESSTDAIMIVDNSGAVRFANGSAQNIYGRSADLVGQHFAIVPGAVEIDIPRPDGTTRTAEVRAIAIEWEGGLASLISLHDITRRKRAQEQIEAEKARLEICVRERTAELVAANSELEAFSHSVSHDLRAPLRHIKGFTQMIEEESKGDLDEPARTLIGRVLLSVDNMERLIDDLLGFSRLGHCQVTKEPVALGPLVGGVIEELGSEVQGRPVEWCIDDLPCLDADPGLLRVVLVNLLSNALKFTRGRDPARIEVFPAGGSHGAPVIAVRDNGAGFAAENAERLFGVFQRLHTQAEFEGTGIGLATVKRIITKHGGRIWAEAEPGMGATFFFSVGSDAS
jgi:signal transduction histidine kinase